MKRLQNRMVFAGAQVLVGAIFVVSSFLVAVPRATAGCGCMDIALVVDDSGSMGGAIDSVKAELPAIVAAAKFASGGDLQMGVVSFPGIGLANDGILVRQELTANITAVENAIQALTAAGGAGEPEPSDVALQFVVTGSTAPSSCVVSNSPFGTFRPACVKIAVLITDAHPGECLDAFTNGVSDVYAHNVAVQAASAGVLVSSVYVPTGGEDPSIKVIMEDYANVTGGTFVQTEPDGTGTGEGVLDAIASCGRSGSGQCVTRNSSFWFTHANSNDSSERNCASLLRALTANGGIMNLGFLRLPVTFENSDNVIDEFDAMMEELGFYWKGKGVTGENGGHQSAHLKGSRLCNARKQLSVELIAATANVRLLGTRPSNCTYSSGGTVSNFPADLLTLARTVASGSNPNACKQMTSLLKKFNNSGVTNDFPSELVECSPNDKKTLKSIARDPTTQLTCPGLNDNCATAQEVFFQAKNPPYSKAKFTVSPHLENYPSGVAYWSVSPPTALSNRTFRVSAETKNFNTTLSVLTGTCALITSNGTSVVDTNGLTTVATATGSNYETRVSFTTDGISTFLIQVQPAPLTYPGKVSIHVNSP